MHFHFSLSGVLLLGLGVLLVLTPWFIFPVCEVFGNYAQTSTGKLLIMPCGYTARAEIGVGSMTALVGAIAFAYSAIDVRRALGVIGAALGGFAILFPTVITKMCSNPSHPCVTGTLPALVLLGGGTILVSAYLFLKG